MTTTTTVWHIRVKTDKKLKCYMGTRQTKSALTCVYNENTNISY